MSKYPTRFLRYIHFIIDTIEGGYSNHKADTGGKTMWGITEALARHYGYKGDMRSLSKETAIDIYYHEFWKNKIVSTIDNDLALHIFDCAINSGNTRAVKILQEALGVTADGIVGKNTRSALSKFTEAEIITRFNICRMYFYAGLSNYKTFGKGWRNRLLKLSLYPYSEILFK